MSEEAKWYYLRDGGSVGPETVGRLLELLDASTITRQTMVWREGAASWQPLDIALGLNLALPPIVPGFSSAPTPTPPSPSHPPVDTEPVTNGDERYPDRSPHPWRRYFARMLDTLIGGSVVIFAGSMLLSATNQSASKAFIDLMSGPSSRFISTILMVGLAIFPNALLIGLTGSSLGKWIFGIAVVKDDGSPLGFRKALEREAMVWGRGLALGIPIISLATLITAFSGLKKNQITSWDADMSLVVGHRSATAAQMALNFLGVGLWIAIVVGLTALDSA